MNLSLIVPALDEAARIGDCVAHLRREHDGELWVADGGSRDGTVAAARRAGAEVIEASRGLARQLNAAVRGASGDALFFVSADSRPSPGWKAAVLKALASPYVVAGGFTLRLEPSSAGLRAIEWGGNFRARYLGITLPDQGLFVRRSALEAAGGFPETSLIPFALLSHRLKGIGEFRLLSHEMTSSSREWLDRGLWRTTSSHLRAYLRFRRELPPHW